MSVKFAFKLVLLGNPAVGKTSLIARFVKNSFSGDYKTTLGVDFLTKELNLFGAQVRMMIWDMGGQEKWLSRRVKFMRGTDGAVIVYSSTDLETFQALQKWTDEVHQYADENIPIIYVKNKSDLPPVREDLIPRDLIAKYSSKVAQTSAKTGSNVEEMFSYIASLIVKQKANEVKERAFRKKE